MNWREAALLLAFGCLFFSMQSNAIADSGFSPAIAKVTLDRTVASAGGKIDVKYTWTNMGTPPSAGDYTVFVHAIFVGATDGSVPFRFGGDYQPALPTYRWYGRTAYTEKQTLQIPSDAPPGRYVLLIGLFDDSGRISLADPALLYPNAGADSYKIAEFTVTAPDQTITPQPFSQSFITLPTGAPIYPHMPSPSKLVPLRTVGMCANMDAEAPIPYGWFGKFSVEMFGGGEPGDAPVFELYRITDGKRLTSRSPEIKVSSHTLKSREPNEIRYAVTLKWGGRKAAEMAFHVKLAGNHAYLSVNPIREYAPYQLMSVSLPSLISLPGTAIGASLITPLSSGGIIPIAQSSPRREAMQVNAWNIRQLFLIQRRNAVAMIEPGSLEDETTMQVLPSVTGAGLAGSLGVKWIYRLAAKDAAHQIRVQRSFGASITFFAGKGVNWVTAARFLRKQERGIRMASIYRNALIYKIDCDFVNGLKPIATFSQALQIIKRIAALTDNTHQIAYLVGWQYHGHDTGYPSVAEINPQLGGMRALRSLVDDAKKCNCIVSAHDNYTDAYQRIPSNGYKNWEPNPAWDTSIIAIGPDGGLEKGGVWASGQSYLVDAPLYVSMGKAKARINDTLKRYPFRKTYHIDVLSSIPVHNDYDPAHPANAADFVRAEIAIVKMFQKHGVDVTSELLTAPFVGPITYFWNLWRQPNTPDFQGEKPIPLIPFIYHGVVGYGGGVSYSGRNTEVITSHEDILQALLYGSNWSEDVTPSTPITHILDCFFFVNIPWRGLNMKSMRSYETLPNGGIRVNYGPKSFVEVNYGEDRYKVVANGSVISENYRTVAPTGKDRWIAYAEKAQDIRVPKGVKQAYLLEENGSRQKTPIVKGVIHAAAKTPYLLTR